ncbi:methyltransferase domain-containing protein [Paludibacter sp.]
MKFNEEIIDYLKGKKFSNSLKVKYSPNKFKLQTRIDELVSRVSGKKIIHLGCADHLDLIDNKIKSGKWLHGIFLKNTNKCIGIDINQETITYLEDKYKIPDLHCIDVLKENDLTHIFQDISWDYLVLGEIIEHVNNPVHFLENIHKKFKGSTSKILITAPNVFNIYNAKNINKNLEVINSDHRYWFSPYTLTKVIMESGFKNCKITYAEQVPFPFIKKVIKQLHKIMRIPYYVSASHFSSLVISAEF